MNDQMPHRRFPCGGTQRCPWRLDAAPGQFPAERYEALRVTAEQNLTAPIFGCHDGAPGSGEDVACAGWLAVVGHRHIGVRIAVASGRLPASALVPGEGWPDLYGSYDELAAVNGAGR